MTEKIQEYFKLFEETKNNREKIREVGKSIINNELEEEQALLKEMRKLLEKTDEVERGWRYDFSENKIISGFISFLTPILNLKSANYLEVSFKDNEDNIKQIYISQRGFYESSGERKSKIYNKAIMGYLGKSTELQEKIKSKADGENLEQMESIFKFLSILYDKMSREYRYYSNIFEINFDKIKFDWYSEVTGKRKNCILIKLKVGGDGIGIEFKEFLIDDKTGQKTLNDDSETIRYGDLEEEDLSLILAIKNDFLSFLKEAKKGIQTGNKEYLELKEKFYEAISPYLLANTL